MAQNFLTYEQQIVKLRDDKGLIVTDENEARKVLEEIGYYSLIAGYKNLFINPAARKYNFGVTFDEIVAFYHFDEQLRSLFLKYILHVERHLKSLISFHFCSKYGTSQLVKDFLIKNKPSHHNPACYCYCNYHFSSEVLNPARKFLNA